MAIEQPEVTENPELATSEFAPTAEQFIRIQNGCIANALAGINGLSNDEKDQLRTEITALQVNVSKAIDLVKSRQARMLLQKKRLAEERAQIGESQSNFSKFYAVATRAVANCEDAAKASQDAKAGVDMVFSRETEIKYREGLLAALELRVAGELRDLESSIEVLDMMVLAIQ